MELVLARLKRIRDELLGMDYTSNQLDQLIEDIEEAWFLDGILDEENE